MAFGNDVFPPVACVGRKERWVALRKLCEGILCRSWEFFNHVADEHLEEEIEQAVLLIIRGARLHDLLVVSRKRRHLRWFEWFTHRFLLLDLMRARRFRIAPAAGCTAKQANSDQ